MTEERYRIEYLPGALEDLVGIARYTAERLNGPQAAERISAALVEGIDTLQALPYRRTVYVPIRPLAHEYRTLRIQGYLAFYWIDEASKTVTVAAVLYQRADIAHRLSCRQAASS